MIHQGHTYADHRGESYKRCGAKALPSRGALDQGRGSGRIPRKRVHIPCTAIIHHRRPRMFEHMGTGAASPCLRWPHPATRSIRLQLPHLPRRDAGILRTSPSGLGARGSGGERCPAGHGHLFIGARSRNRATLPTTSSRLSPGQAGARSPASRRRAIPMFWIPCGWCGAEALHGLQQDPDSFLVDRGRSGAVQEHCSAQPHPDRWRGSDASPHRPRHRGSHPCHSTFTVGTSRISRGITSRRRLLVPLLEPSCSAACEDRTCAADCCVTSHCTLNPVEGGSWLEHIAAHGAVWGFEFRLIDVA